MHLGKDIKDLNRFKEILTVFFEEGFGFYLAKTKLHIHLPFLKRIKPVSEITDKKVQAVRLRQSFERLGPTFVKLGQLLSLRPDLVPKEFSKEFERLQDHVLPFSYKEAKKIVEKELGKPLKEVFKKFDEKPIASASIAQVHKAILNNGKVVAVKVQRPNIKEMIDADLDILFFIAKTLERSFSSMKNYRPVDVVKEFALWTRQEVDFNFEIAHARRLREELKDDPKVDVPKIYPEISSSKICVMDFVEGERIDNIAFLKKHKINRKQLGITYFNSILEQALGNGFFHADPHPANIFIQKSGKLIYLDFGIMGEVSKKDKNIIIKFISTIPEKDPEKSYEIILSLAQEIRNPDLGDFKNFCIKTMEEVYFHSVKEKSFGKALYEIISSGARHGVIFKADHVLFAKAVYQVEGLGMKLDPNFKIADGFKEFADNFLKKKFSVSEFGKNFTHTLWDNRDLILDFPEHVTKIIHNLEKEDKKSEVTTKRIEEMEERIEEQQHNHSFGLMILVLFLASMFLLYLEGYQKLLGLSLSTIMIIVTVGVLFYFIFSNKKNKN